MNLTIYKTKEINGETKPTAEVDYILNVDKLVLHTMSTIELFNIIDIDNLTMILSFISNAGDKEKKDKKDSKELVSMLVPVYKLIKEHTDDILNFIYEVLISNDYKITSAQVRTIKPSEQVQLLMLIFRLLGEEFGLSI